MLFFVGLTDKIGVRLSLIISLAVMAVGRGIVALSDTISLEKGLDSPMFYMMCGGLLLMVAAYGLYQPAAYAGVKRYTNPKTAAMGYAMVYGLMNLGAFFFGMMSPPVRKACEGTLPPNGLAGVFWVLTFLTFAGSLLTFFLLTRKTDREAVEKVARETDEMKKAGEEEEPAQNAEEAPRINNAPFFSWLTAGLALLAFLIFRVVGWITLEPKPLSFVLFGRNRECDLITSVTVGLLVLVVLWAIWEYLKQRPDHPFRNGKFLFFIFILIPVQTLFAHNWLTIPYYMDRAFAGTAVSDYFEFFSNLNPIMIFVFAPLIAGFTARADIYKMMILGSFVMAVPTFLLAIGPNVVIFLVYVLIMSVGEAMWQPRFLQWIAEIAPKGKTGAYMGIGQFPWFLTKMLTSLYSGWFIKNYCPAPESGLEMRTGEMWFYYALIAMISPVALILAAKWMRKGMKQA